MIGDSIPSRDPKTASPGDRQLVVEQPRKSRKHHTNGISGLETEKQIQRDEFMRSLPAKSPSGGSEKSKTAE